MKRVLSLVLALVLVLGMIPTFAAEKTGGEELKALGLLSGNENGDLMVDQTLERQEFAKIVAQLNGALEEAEGYVTPGTFADFDKVEGWAKRYVAYAEEQGWMTGKTGNIFDPAAELKSQELIVVLLRVLGYDDTWSKAFETAAEVGLVSEEIAAIKRGDAFELIWSAVNTKMADSEMTLGEHLGVLEPAKPVVTALEVKSVTATNLKTMVVEFNKAVDQDTITATTVKAVKGTTNVIDTNGLLLSEDGKTLTIVYTSSAVNQSTEVKLTINGVKSVDGTEQIKDYTSTTVVNDVVIPQVLSVTALNAKQIEVFFSEPMSVTDTTAFSVLSSVKINGIAAIAKTTQNFVKNSVVYELSTALEAKTHSVEIKDLTDYATYKAITKTLEFTVIEDKAAPSLVSATVKAINKIEVAFNESVSAQGNFWVNGQVATITPVANSNGTKFTLTGFNALDLGAIIEIKVEYQNQTDVVGNKVSTKTLYTFNVQDDTTIPTVAVAVGAGNKLTLTFSKSMLENTGTIQILKSTKAVHSSVINVTTFKTGSNDTVIELANTATSLNNLNAGTYFVNIKGMKDATVRGNVLPEQTLEILVVDSKQPEVVGGYSVAANVTTGTNPQNDDTITFFFSEAMDVETLKNLSNYVNENSGLAFSAISGVSFKSASADGKSVTITYPSANDLTTEEFTIYALKDLAGNMLMTKNNIAKLGVADTFGVTATAVATAKDKVVLTFNTPMASVDPSFIKITNATEDIAVPVAVSIGGTGTNAGKVVTFTLNKSIGTATAGLNVVVVNKTAAADIYGQAYASAAPTPTITTFTDEISPVLVSITQKYVNPAAPTLVAVPNQFVIKLSENIAFTELNLKNDLIIKYADGTPVANGAYTLTAEGTDSILVTLAPNAGLTNGTNSITAQLFAARDLRDTVAAPNYADVFDATAVNLTVDAVAPVATLTAPVAGAQTALVVTFDTPVHASTKAITDINALLSAASNDSTGTPAAISVASAAGTVVWSVVGGKDVATITIPSTTFVTGQSVRINFVTNAVKDLTGNAIAATVNVVAVVVAP